MASVSRVCAPVQRPCQTDEFEEARQTAPAPVNAIPASDVSEPRHIPNDSPDGESQPAEPTPDDRPAESWPRFTLAELADQEAMAYRAWCNDVGELFAKHMDELALKIRMTDATNVEEYEGRIEIYEDEIRANLEARGFDAGLQAAREQCRCGMPAWD